MNDLIDQSLWAQARAAYLAGETAEAVCARLGLGRSAFFTRAASEGWRRSDQPSRDYALEPVEPLGEARQAVDLAEDAMARASDAVVRGRLHDAEGWTRLALKLRQMAMQEEGRATWQGVLETALARDERHRELDAPDSRPAEVSALSHDGDKIISADPDSVDGPAPRPKVRPELKGARRQLEAYVKARAAAEARRESS